MHTRRNFIRNAFFTAGGLSLPGAIPGLDAAQLAANPQGILRSESGFPMRFIFIRKSSGLIPEDLVPVSFSDKDKAIDAAKGELDIDLRNHEMPAYMKPVEFLRDRLTILQGLSGKMMRVNGHWPDHSCLALVDSGGRAEDLVRASVDFELARLFPSPFTHIGFSAAKNVTGIQPGLSVKEPGLANYEYCTPSAAYADIFGAISDRLEDQAEFKMRGNLMEFAAGRQKAKLQAAELAAAERQKVLSYVQSTEALRHRGETLKSMSGRLKACAPILDDRFLANEVSTSDKQIGLAEIATSALIAGVTNVVTLNMDDTDTIYPELGLDGGTVHDIGHNKTVGGIAAREGRSLIREQHMRVVALMVGKLSRTPEGDGTMFDNTMVFYLTDNGEKHHPTCEEWPFIVFSGKNSQLDIAGRYVRFPKHGELGHKTLGNWYTTLLNAYGNPIEHYGSLDPALEKLRIDQLGRIREFIA
jgi:hypothetical protein